MPQQHRNGNGLQGRSRGRQPYQQQQQPQGSGRDNEGSSTISVPNRDGDPFSQASAIPPPPSSPAPLFHTASLCSSSASSEPYVSPRDSDDDDAEEEKVSGPTVHHPSTENTRVTEAEFKGDASQGREQGGAETVGKANTNANGAAASPPVSSPARTTLPPTHTPSVLEEAAQHRTLDATGSPHQHQQYPPQLTSQQPPPLPPPPHTHFQYIHSFDYRCRLAAKMRALYGNEAIPVIVEPAESHHRPSSPAAAAYESKRLAAETRYRGADVGRSLLVRLGLQDAPSPTASVRGGGTGIGAAGLSAAPALSASAVAALSSPSTRSTVKCILPSAKSVAEIILTLRDRLALDSCQSIFLSVGESDALVPGNSLLGDLYQRYRHPDGFLYLSYLLENTFGGLG